MFTHALSSARSPYTFSASMWLMAIQLALSCNIDPNTAHTWHRKWTNELLSICQAMRSELNYVWLWLAHRFDSYLFNLTQMRMIRCVIFPDFIRFIQFALQRPEKDHRKMFYLSLSTRFMFAEFYFQKKKRKTKAKETNNVFLLLWRRRWQCRRNDYVLNSIYTLTNDVLTFVSVIHFFWTEFRYRDVQTMPIP